MSSIVIQRSVTFINGETPAKLTIKDIDLDKCYNDNEIVVKVHSAALNPVDLLVHHSANRHVVSSGLKTYGRDYAGIIVKKGRKVDPKFQVGDKINGQITHLYGEQGSVSNYLVVNPAQNASIGFMNDFGYLDFDIKTHYNEYDLNASYPLVFGTAYMVLFNNGQHWNPNSKILVHGASTAVSQCLIQIAKKHLNVGTVVGICNSKSFEYNKKAGFDHLIAYDEPEYLEKVQALVKDTFKGEKFDLIFDSVGTSQYFPIIDEILKPRNENSIYTTIAGNDKLKYEGGLLDYARRLPFSYYLNSFNPWRKFNYVLTMLGPKSEYMELASLMIHKKQFIPPLDSVYKLDDFQKALDKLNSNKAKGKVIIRIVDE